VDSSDLASRYGARRVPTSRACSIAHAFGDRTQ